MLCTVPQIADSHEQTHMSSFTGELKLGLLV